MCAVGKLSSVTRRWLLKHIGKGHGLEVKSPIERFQFVGKNANIWHPFFHHSIDVWSPGASDSPNDLAAVKKRKKLTVGDVFNQDDDDNNDGVKKRKLVPLEYSKEERAVLDPGGEEEETPTRPTTAEEKRKCIKNLIEKIPTAKEELFAYTLDWNMVDTVSGAWHGGSINWVN